MESDDWVDGGVRETCRDLVNIIGRDLVGGVRATGITSFSFCRILGNRIAWFINIVVCLILAVIHSYKLKASLGTAFFSQVVGQLGFFRKSP